MNYKKNRTWKSKVNQGFLAVMSCLKITDIGVMITNLGADGNKCRGWLLFLGYKW